MEGISQPASPSILQRLFLTRSVHISSTASSALLNSFLSSSLVGSIKLHRKILVSFFPRAHVQQGLCSLKPRFDNKRIKFHKEITMMVGQLKNKKKKAYTISTNKHLHSN